jgi:hypothetical protein
MNFLRPVYTEYLFKQLQKQSLNVYGAVGQGRERLLDRPQPKTVWILLDHFDAVLNRTELDPQFGIAFFDPLNALKNRPRCFLLCVTAKLYQKYHLF